MEEFTWCRIVVDQTSCWDGESRWISFNSSWSVLHRERFNLTIAYDHCRWYICRASIWWMKGSCLFLYVLFIWAGMTCRRSSFDVFAREIIEGFLRLSIDWWAPGSMGAAKWTEYHRSSRMKVCDSSMKIYLSLFQRMEWEHSQRWDHQLHLLKIRSGIFGDQDDVSQTYCNSIHLHQYL